MSGKNPAIKAATERAVQRIKRKCGTRLEREDYTLIYQEVQEAIRMVLQNMKD